MHMARKNGIQNTVFQWAYQSRKTGNRAANVLRSIEEAEKTLNTVKIKKIGGRQLRSPYLYRYV